MDLLSISERYQKTAGNFLRDSGFSEILSKFGRVEYEGAYAGNVMLNGDIDIKVIRQNDFTTEEMFEILKNIHSACPNVFRSYYVKGDWEDSRFGEQFPFGKYLGFKTVIDDEKWKCDVWFMSEAESNRDRGVIDISKLKLSFEQRKTILEFKEYRRNTGSKVSGQEIYQAVLEKNCVNPTDFFTK